MSPTQADFQSLVIFTFFPPPWFFSLSLLKHFVLSVLGQLLTVGWLRRDPLTHVGPRGHSLVHRLGWRKRQRGGIRPHSQYTLREGDIIRVPYTAASTVNGMGSSTYMTPRANRSFKTLVKTYNGKTSPCKVHHSKAGKDTASTWEDSLTIKSPITAWHKSLCADLGYSFSL